LAWQAEAAVNIDRFTRASRDVVLRARAFARHLGHRYVGTEHLVLALCDAPATRTVLLKQGADAATVEAAVVSIVGYEPAQPAVEVGFTPRARSALRYAMECAPEGDEVAPLHLLGGVLAEGEGVGCAALVAAEVDLAELKRAVRKSLD
jgi:ATP-dependent Clp protease ATP-binding subunit ClpA